MSSWEAIMPSMRERWANNSNISQLRLHMSDLKVSGFVGSKYDSGGRTTRSALDSHFVLSAGRKATPKSLSKSLASHREISSLGKPSQTGRTAEEGTPVGKGSTDPSRRAIGSSFGAPNFAYNWSIVKLLSEAGNRNNRLPK